MQPYTEFGLKATAIMNQKRITMTAIAKKLDITPQYVSCIFTGKTGNGKKAHERKKQIAELIGMEETTNNERTSI